MLEQVARVLERLPTHHGRAPDAMRDHECVALLQWELPRLGLRWSGFRRVRRQVCRRISRRMAELGIRDVAVARLAPGGALLLGAREELPEPSALVPSAQMRGLYRAPGEGGA